MGSSSLPRFHPSYSRNLNMRAACLWFIIRVQQVSVCPRVMTSFRAHHSATACCLSEARPVHRN
eukprot:4195491-Alexandrium_andersonii.AAC.1